MMAAYLEKLHSQWNKKGTILCFGMDPVVERMKLDPSKNLSDEINRYFDRILHAISGRISAVKPNVAYYLQYGAEGLKALGRLVDAARGMELPVIVDAKVGDIGRSSTAYGKFVFEELGGDAVTLNPYMGDDSISPFLRYAEKGFYVLALTSNEGARVFEYAELAGEGKLYERVLQKICTWANTHEALGAVIGATQTQFKECIEQLSKNKCFLPLLIPGVGTQGGSYQKVKAVLDGLHYDPGIVRINASSAISYAHEKWRTSTVEDASCNAVEEILRT
jgi:orotidine 5'-phosphate decarboxylase subfamily 2